MNAVTEFRSRLPMPGGLTDFDARRWRVLVETTFPTARTSEAVVMAIDYCQARGLDIFKKPVHIVPMWNATLGKEVETVWPGINEVQITASRTGEWAGMDKPVWGPDTTRDFKGRKKGKNGWENVEATVTFPDWCEVTVYRMKAGQRCPFTETVYWTEAYSTTGGSELPTHMWIKRPRGQLQKVAKAASLRAAFPEEGEYTAEEMEGKEIEAGGVVINHEPTRHGPPVAPPSAAHVVSEEACIKKMAAANNLDELHEVVAMAKGLDGEARDRVREYFIARKVALTPVTNSPPAPIHVPLSGRARKEPPPAPPHNPDTGEIQDDESGIPEHMRSEHDIVVREAEIETGPIMTEAQDSETWMKNMLKMFADVKTKKAIDNAWFTLVEPQRAEVFPGDFAAVEDAFHRAMERIEKAAKK